MINSEDAIERSARVISIAATGRVPVFRYTRGQDLIGLARRSLETWAEIVRGSQQKTRFDISTTRSKDVGDYLFAIAREEKEMEKEPNMGC
jgi:hypothetical protein